MNPVPIVVGFFIALISRKWWHVLLACAVFTAAFETMRLFTDSTATFGTLGDLPQSYYWTWLISIFSAYAIYGFIFYAAKVLVLRRFYGKQE